MKIQNESGNYSQYKNNNVQDNNVYNKEQKENAKEAGKENGKASVSKDTNGVFAGDLNLFQDPVEEKKKQAREMAMKLIEEAYAKDKVIDEDLDNRRNHAKELEDENKEHLEMLNGIDKMKKEAREGHGVGEYSQEEKDAQLLLKEAKQKRNPNRKILTDEEQQELENIHKTGLTAYQEEVLRLDEGAYEYEKKMEENEMEIMSEYAVIRGMKIERLKTHEMVDAVKSGDQILQSAQKEIIGMILEDGKEEQDEKLAEKKEEIEEKKEEAEELEEKIEEARARREEATKREEDDQEEIYELDSLLQEITEKVANSNLPNVQKSMTQAVNELLLTLDDIKGLAVDTEV